MERRPNKLRTIFTVLSQFDKLFGSDLLSSSAFYLLCITTWTKIQDFVSHKSEKGRIVDLVQVSKILNLKFGVPKTSGSIFRGQGRNNGMDPPVLKVREYPSWALKAIFQMLISGKT